MEASSPELPSDLAVEILLRLPVKTLLRSKSVCKSWRLLIESPGFISRHINRSVSCGDGKNGNGARSLIVEYRCPATQEDRMARLSGQTLDLGTPVEIPPHLHSQSWRIVGCCNGVVCLCYGGQYSLWNPAMRQYRVLPKCLISRGSQVLYCTVYDGFGYDPAMADYKIVRICGTYIINKVYVRVEVFALSEGSWREIPASDCRVCSSECVSVGGALYWGIGLRVSDDHRILSFGLRDEVFRRVCYPDPALIGNKKHQRLTSYEESLCLIVFNYTAIGTVLDLWVLEGGPGKESCTKRSSVEAVIGIHKPLGCGLNGGILVEKRDGVLAIYEADKESVRDLPVKGVRYSLDCHFYIESLVRVIR